MDTVTLGNKGQVSIPQHALRRLGLEGGELLLVETTADGAIVLRPAAVYPIEIYSDERVSEFLAEDEMPARIAAKVQKALGESKRPKPEACSSFWMRMCSFLRPAAPRGTRAPFFSSQQPAARPSRARPLRSRRPRAICD